MANIYDSRNKAERKFYRWLAKELDTSGGMYHETGGASPTDVTSDAIAVVAALATLMENKYKLTITP